MLLKNCSFNCKLISLAAGQRRPAKYQCWLAQIVLILASLNSSGCDGAKESNLIQVNGRVTKAGMPLHVEGYDVGIGAVRVAFHLIQNGETASSAFEDTAADEKGYFKVRDGLPAGKYRIVIEQWDPHPVIDRLKGRFNRLNSRIVRTVSHEEGYVEIDLADEVSVSDGNQIDF